MRVEIESRRHALSIHVVWLMLMVSFLAVYRMLPPASCIFHEVTGFPCLSCGLSRAIDAFLAGDFVNMLYYNPLAVIFFGGLFLFSLLKLLEFIFRFKLKVELGAKAGLFARILLLFTIVGNWLFLVGTGR